MPRWYLTSPEPEKSCSFASGVATPWNSLKICSIGLRTTLASTLSRPRCGMPITMFSTPCSVAVSMSSFMPTMSTSQPSRPKRFAVEYLFARNDSKWSDQHSRSSMRSFCSLEKMCLLGVSICSRIQLTCS